MIKVTKKEKTIKKKHFSTRTFLKQNLCKQGTNKKRLWTNENERNFNDEI